MLFWGRLAAVENDRREDQQPTNPPPSYEASNPAEDRREWERDPAEGREEPRRREREHDEGRPSSGDQPPYESAQPPEGGGQTMPPGGGGQMGPAGGGPGGAGGPGRGRRRGGRGRMAPRECRCAAGGGTETVADHHHIIVPASRAVQASPMMTGKSSVIRTCHRSSVR